MISLQLAFPASSGTFFDYDYCFGQHQRIVAEHIGEHVSAMLVTKGVPGPSGQPPSFYAIATLTFASKPELESALAKSQPVMDDFGNFTDAEPITLFGDVIVAELPNRKAD